MVTAGFTVFDPLASTRPMPLSTSTDSAPSTAHDSVVAAPASISVGMATKRCMARGLSVSEGSMKRHAASAATRTSTRMAALRGER